MAASGENHTFEKRRQRLSHLRRCSKQSSFVTRKTEQQDLGQQELSMHDSIFTNRSECVRVYDFAVCGAACPRAGEHKMHCTCTIGSDRAHTPIHRYVPMLMQWRCDSTHTRTRCAIQ